MALTTMKYSEIVNELSRRGVDDAQLEAGVILEELFGASRTDILLDRQREYDSEKIMPIIEQRGRKIPLQYILGAWYFMGRKFLWLAFFLKKVTGGDDGIRTHDPLLAGQVLSQLSYTPIIRLLGFAFSIFNL